MIPCISSHTYGKTRLLLALSEANAALPVDREKEGKKRERDRVIFEIEREREISPESCFL